MSNAGGRPDAPATAAPMTLIQELNHRIANDYTILLAELALAAAHLPNPEGRAALVVAQGRLHAFANAHRALLPPMGSADLDLAAYLELVCGVTARARMIEPRLTLRLSAEEIVVSAA